MHSYRSLTFLLFVFLFHKEFWKHIVRLKTKAKWHNNLKTWNFELKGFANSMWFQDILKYCDKLQEVKADKDYVQMEVDVVSIDFLCYHGNKHGSVVWFPVYNAFVVKFPVKILLYLKNSFLVMIIFCNDKGKEFWSLN